MGRITGEQHAAFAEAIGIAGMEGIDGGAFDDGPVVRRISGDQAANGRSTASAFQLVKADSAAIERNGDQHPVATDVDAFQAYGTHPAQP